MQELRDFDLLSLCLPPRRAMKALYSITSTYIHNLKFITIDEERAHHTRTCTYGSRDQNAFLGRVQIRRLMATAHVPHFQISSESGRLYLSSGCRLLLAQNLFFENHIWSQFLPSFFCSIALKRPLILNKPTYSIQTALQSSKIEKISLGKNFGTIITQPKSSPISGLVPIFDDFFRRRRITWFMILALPGKCGKDSHGRKRNDFGYN